AISTSNLIPNSTFMYLDSGISFDISKTFNTHYMYGVTNSFCSNQHLVVNTASSEIQDNKSSDLNNNQENIILFNISTIQDPM
ncbi:17254_t:CDS:2, partial [Dentiscutata heterogama]